MKNYLIILILLSSYQLIGQYDPLKESEKITPDNLRKHIEYLASDSLEGRKTGEKGQRLAANYIAKQFEDFGLTPAINQGGENQWFQQLEIDRLKDFSYLLVKIDDKDSISGMQNLLFFGKMQFQNPVTLNYEYANGQKPAPGNGLYFKAQNLQEGIGRISSIFDSIIVKDFIISVPDKEYKSILKEYFFLMQKKIVIEQDSADYYKVIFTKPKRVDSFVIKKYIPPFLESNPNCRIVVTSEEIIRKFFSLKEIKKAEKNEITTTVLSKNLKLRAVNNLFRTDTIETENVIAKIEGTEKNGEAIVICGHYDHLGTGYFKNENGKYEKKVYNGADDNASGTSAVIETARLFAEAEKAGHKPKRTILFIAFTAEEDGLLGSEYYVRNPIVPIAKTHAVINMDMIGRTNKFYTETDNYVNAMNKRAKGKLKKLNRKNGKLLGLKIDFTPGLKERLLMNFGSDHHPFVRRDVPAIIISTGDHPDYHQPTDDADKINYNRAALITRLAFLDAWDLANE